MLQWNKYKKGFFVGKLSKVKNTCNCQMGYWVVSEYWLIIQSFNEQTALLNIYTFTFKKLKWIHFNLELTKWIHLNLEVTIN